MDSANAPRTGVRNFVPVLAVAGLLAAVHFLVPAGVQQALAFDHSRFRVYTLLTSAYVHNSDAHLYGNLVGYLVVATYSYMLCAAVGERRWFRRTFLVFLLVLPVLVNLASYAVYATQYPDITPVSRGFSGVVAGFAGFLLVALAVYVRERWSAELGGVVGVSTFLVLLASIDAVYAGRVRLPVGALVVTGIGLQVGSYAWEADLDVAELDWRRVGTDVGAVALVCCVLGFVVMALFPTEIVAGGAMTNVVAHAFGFVMGTLVATATNRVGSLFPVDRRPWRNATDD